MKGKSVSPGLPRAERPNYTDLSETAIAEIWVDDDDGSVRVVVQFSNRETGHMQSTAISLTSAAARDIAKELNRFATEVERIERARPLNGQLSILDLPGSEK